MIWRRLIRRCLGWQWLRGDYRTWAEASAHAAGYHAEAEVERAAAAARSVRRGDALWERDGFLFHTAQIHAPLLEELLEQARLSDGHLTVVDIGGAFGSSWWQHRAQLETIKPISWRIVEQPAFVAVGREEFASNILSFHESVAEACEKPHGRVVALLSSVLPYVPEPLALVEQVKSQNIDKVIVDRTPFVRTGPGRLVVQQVPPELGGGSYPCRLFSKPDFLEAWRPKYVLSREWAGFDDFGAEVDFLGLSFSRNAESYSGK